MATNEKRFLGQDAAERMIQHFKDLLSKLRGEIPDLQAQADWDQTDSTAPDFIKNKPENIIDAALDAESENAVQNKVIKSEFDNVNSAIEEVRADITEHTWESLPDKPFGESDAVEIINAVVDSTNVNNGVNDIYNVYYLGDNTLEVGKTYNITIDDVSESMTATENYGKTYIYCVDSNYNYQIIYVSEPKSNINISESSTTLPVSGVYVMTLKDVSSVTITEEGSIRYLDEAYIPSSVSRTDHIHTEYAEVDHSHSWNDLTDKPFGEQLIYPYIEETTVKAGPYFDDHATIPVSAEWNSDYAYTVVFDGVVHEGLVIRPSVDGNYISASFLGVNLSEENLWCIVVSEGQAVLQAYENTEHTIEVYANTGVSKLDEQYIPETIARTDHIHEDYAYKSDILSPVQADLSQTDTESLDYVKGHTPDDAIALVSDCGLINIATDENGAILVDENNDILI